MGHLKLIAEVLIIVLPILVGCFLFYYFGAKARNPAVKAWLKRSAIAAPILMCFIGSGFILALITCEGNILYSSADCAVFPASFAIFVVLAFLASWFVIPAYGLLLILICVVVERRHARKTSQD